MNGWIIRRVLLGLTKLWLLTFAETSAGALQDLFAFSVHEALTLPQPMINLLFKLHVPDLILFFREEDFLCLNECLASPRTDLLVKALRECCHDHAWAECAVLSDLLMLQLLLLLHSSLQIPLTLFHLSLHPIQRIFICFSELLLVAWVHLILYLIPIIFVNIKIIKLQVENPGVFILLGGHDLMIYLTVQLRWFLSRSIWLLRLVIELCWHVLIPLPRGTFLWTGRLLPLLHHLWLLLFWSHDRMKFWEVGHVVLGGHGLDVVVLVAEVVGPEFVGFELVKLRFFWIHGRYVLWFCREIGLFYWF